MRSFEVSFRPKIWFVITRAELDYLLKCSSQHYDFHCQQQARVGGFLYGFNNMMYEADEVEVGLEWRELDTLCKIVEMDRSNPIWLELGQMLRRSQDLTPDMITVEAK